MHLIPITLLESGSPPFVGHGQGCLPTPQGGFGAALSSVLAQTPGRGILPECVLPAFPGGAGTPDGGGPALPRPDGRAAAAEAAEPEAVLSRPPVFGEGTAGTGPVPSGAAGVAGGPAPVHEGVALHRPEASANGVADRARAGPESGETGPRVVPAAAEAWGAKADAGSAGNKPAALPQAWLESDRAGSLVKPTAAPLEDGGTGAVRPAPAPGKTGGGEPSAGSLPGAGAAARFPDVAASDRGTAGPPVRRESVPVFPAGGAAEIKRDGPPAAAAAVERVSPAVRNAVPPAPVEAGIAKADAGSAGDRPAALPQAWLESDRAGSPMKQAAERAAPLRAEAPSRAEAPLRAEAPSRAEVPFRAEAPSRVEMTNRIEVEILRTGPGGADAGVARPPTAAPREDGGTGAVRPVPAPGKTGGGEPSARSQPDARAAARFPDVAASDRGTAGPPVRRESVPAFPAGGAAESGRNRPPAAAAAVERASLSALSDRPAPVQAPNPAPGAHTATAGAGAQAELPAVARQLAEAVMVQVRRLQAGAGQSLLVRITLDPPQLGRVTLKLTFGRDGLEAQFITPDRAVKGVIEQALPQLREALLRQEINLGNAAVFLGQEESGERAARLWRGLWAGGPAPDEVPELRDDGDRIQTNHSAVDYLV